MPRSRRNASSYYPWKPKSGFQGDWSDDNHTWQPKSWQDAEKNFDYDVGDYRASPAEDRRRKLSWDLPEDTWYSRQQSKGNKCPSGNKLVQTKSVGRDWHTDVSNSGAIEMDSDKDACSFSRRCSSSTASDASGAENRSSSPDSYRGHSELEQPQTPPPPPDSPPRDGTRGRWRSEAHVEKLKTPPPPQYSPPRDGTKATHMTEVDATSQMRSAHAEAVLSAVVLAATQPRKSTRNEWLAKSIPSADELARVARCVEELNTIAAGLDSTWRVFPFGSHVNGLALCGSDLDATLVTPTSQQQDAGGCRAISVLKEQLWPLLRNHSSFKVTELVFTAKVPIIKLRFEDALDVDLSCHNRRPLENTRLIKAYAEMHPSVQELILTVKLWAKAAGVCGAAEGKLSCYTFALMVIYYMQADWLVNLPCLPTTAFELDSEESPSDQQTQWSSPVPLTLLLDRFFMFYSEIFAWGDEVVSVRLGRRVEANSNEFSNLYGRSSRRIHVEDPYDLKRNLHCVLGAQEENDLMAAFAEASGVAHELVSSIKHSAPRLESEQPEVQSSQASQQEPEPEQTRRERHHARRERHRDKPRQRDMHENARLKDAKLQPLEEDDWRWWLTYTGSVSLYAIYAMFSGQLGRLCIACFFLMLVLYTVGRKPKSSSKGRHFDAVREPKGQTLHREKDAGLTKFQ